MTAHTPSTFDADVVLIGAGIMSATLGAILRETDPALRIVVVEQADDVARESSDAWNNAGTGHSGFCELNYMPDPTDATRAIEIAEQFRVTRQWWEGLIAAGRLPGDFIRTVPHLTVVFGVHDVAALRQRFDTLRGHPLFAAMEYTEDRETIARWAPPVMRGRPYPTGPTDPTDSAHPVAATRHPGGTDVDFGALTRALLENVAPGGDGLLLRRRVTRIRRTRTGWSVRGHGPGGRSDTFDIHARRVFVGAGGMALRLLQAARIPEIRGYGVLPVGAAFLRCSDPDIARQLDAKVYGQSAVGAPPMSVPHLDRRCVRGEDHLMFGPYATFSTKLLRRGRATDFFTTLRPGNVAVVAAAVAQNSALIRYLLGELRADSSDRFSQLQRFFPTADPDQWELVLAGQRAQLVKPDRRRIGVLAPGTELVVSADRSIAGLLGASPGASTAVPIMLALARRWFPEPAGSAQLPASESDGDGWPV